MGLIFGDWSKGDIFDDDGIMGWLKDHKGEHAHKRDNKLYGTIKRNKKGGLTVKGKHGYFDVGYSAKNIKKWSDKGYRYIKSKNEPITESDSPTSKATLQSLSTGGAGGYGGGGGRNYDAENLAYINRKLGRFGSYFDNLKNQYDGSLRDLDEQYQLGQRDVNSAFNRADRDYQYNRNRLYKTRTNRRNANDADYRNKTTMWQRFLANRGAGNSSMSKYVLPELINKEAEGINQQIEDDYAQDLYSANRSFNEAKERKKNTLDSLFRTYDSNKRSLSQNYQRQEASLKEKEADLRHQRGKIQGRHINDIMRETDGLIKDADNLYSQAASSWKNKPKLKVDTNGIKYDAINPDKLNLGKPKQDETEISDGSEKTNSHYRWGQETDEEKKKKKQKKNYKTLASLI